MEQSIYLLLDSKGSPIARGKIQGSTSGQFWQLQVEDGKIDEILEHKKLKLLSIMDAGPSYEGVIVRSRNDMIQLEITRLDQDAGDMRKNLRVVARFKSLIYPLSGSWKGRPPPPGGGAAGDCHPRHQRTPGAQVPGAAPAPHRAGLQRAVRRQICGYVRGRGDVPAGGGVQPPAAGQAKNKLSPALGSRYSC